VPTGEVGLGVETRDEFETDSAQTPRKTGHHPGPEDKASQQDRQPDEICKTSIPGSNPGGASISSSANSTIPPLLPCAARLQLFSNVLGFRDRGDTPIA
jgi:hypothetical protein